MPAPGPAGGPAHPSWPSLGELFVAPDPARPPTKPDGELLVTATFGTPTVYAGLWGSPYVIYRRFAPHGFAEWEEVEDYQGGAPDGPWGVIPYDYSCIWVALALVRPPPAKPAAKKRWADLSPRTKQGYRGPLRQLGLRTEAQFADYYEHASNLGFLRRHPTGRLVDTTGNQWKVRRRGGRDLLYMVTWQQN